MTAFVRYDAACHALPAASSLDEVKDIRDKLAFGRTPDRQATVSFELEPSIKAIAVVAKAHTDQEGNGDE